MNSFQFGKNKIVLDWQGKKLKERDHKTILKAIRKQKKELKKVKQEQQQKYFQDRQQELKKILARKKIYQAFMRFHQRKYRFEVDVAYQCDISGYSQAGVKEFTTGLIGRQNMALELRHQCQAFLDEYIKNIPAAQGAEITDINVIQYSPNDGSLDIGTAINNVLQKIHYMNKPSLQLRWSGSNNIYTRTYESKVKKLQYGTLFPEEEFIELVNYTFEDVNNNENDKINCLMFMLSEINGRRQATKHEKKFTKAFLGDVQKNIWVVQERQVFILSKLIELCDKHGVFLQVYNILGDLIHGFKVKSWKQVKSVKLRFLLYQNHCYHVNQRFLKRLENRQGKYSEFVALDTEEFSEMLDKVHAECLLKQDLYRRKVKHFIYRDIMYHEKGDIIEQMIKVQQLFVCGLKDMDLNIGNLFFSIMKMQKIELKKSIILTKCIKNKAIIKKFSDYDENIEYCYIDKNKQYPNILSNMEKLTWVDQTVHEMYECQLPVEEIYQMCQECFIFGDLEFLVNGKWYVHPTQMWFIEDAIKYQREDRRFIVKGVQQCGVYDNNLGELIREYYRFCIDNGCMDVFKKSMVIFIGILSKTVQKEQVCNTDIRVVKNPELLLETDRVMSNNYFKGYSLVQGKKGRRFGVKEQMKISVGISQSWQIISLANLQIVDKAQNSGEEILFINTDGFFCRENIEIVSDAKDFDGYKQSMQQIRYKESVIMIQMFHGLSGEKFIQIRKAKPGGGKTTTIISLAEFVIAPQYTCLKKYIADDVKCHVLDLLWYNIGKLEKGKMVLNKLLGEDLGSILKRIPTIYIDEFYLCNSYVYELMYRLNRLYGSKFICYGDDKQLPPVDYKIISQQFKDQYVEEIEIEWDNKRNDFSAEQYDKMLDDKFTFENAWKVYQYHGIRKGEICKMQQMFNEDLYSICLRHEQIDKYYQRYLQEYGLEHFYEGQRVMCKKNGVIGSGKDGVQVYNKQIFWICRRHPEDQEMCLKSENGDLLKCENMENWFDQSQFVTLNSVQGMDCRIHCFSEVYREIWQDKRRLYTLLSRSSKRLSKEEQKQISVYFQ